MTETNAVAASVHGIRTQTDAAKVTKLKNLRVVWVIANNDQTASGRAAQTTRAELKTLLNSIEDRRMAIQLAAHAEWPHPDPENAAIRKEFGLPPAQADQRLNRTESITGALEQSGAAFALAKKPGRAALPRSRATSRPSLPPKLIHHPVCAFQPAPF